MPDLFISYSRDDSLAMGVIRDNLRKLGFNLWIDIEHLKPGTPQWARAIKAAIVKVDGMIVVCSPSAEQSEWVNREVSMAKDAGIPIIAALVRGEKLLEAIPAEIFGDQYCDMRGRSDPRHGFDELVARLVAEFGADVPAYEFEHGGHGVPSVQVINVYGHVEGNVIAIGRDVSGEMNVAGRDMHIEAPPRPPDPTPLQGQSRPAATLPLQGEGKPSAVARLGGVSPPTLNAEAPRYKPVLVTHLPPSGPTNPAWQDTDAQAAQGQLRHWTPIAIVGSLVALGLLIGGLALGGVFGGNQPAAPATEPISATQPVRVTESVAPTTPSDAPTVAASVTLTETRRPAFTPVPPTEPPVTRNADWTPIIQAFDGVAMARVPAGCFMMGSNAGQSDEQPVHEVCFDTPFWIDVTEVTNGQYGSEGNFKGADRPRESVSWNEAKAHCEQRGARLPTEAEWEYAARGPDNWVYPWGNSFVADNVVYSGNSNSQTASVGSKPGGVSWVGALDLSGNVWEWVADWYGTYPSEKQVNPSGLGSGVYRALRGGAWNFVDSDLRAPNRSWGNPTGRLNVIGFRCARSSWF